MNMLLYDNGNHLQTDLELSLSQFGHTLYKIYAASINEETVIDSIKKLDIKCIFSFSYFSLISTICERENILYMCWIVDSFRPDHDSIKNSCNRLCFYDRSQYDQCKEITDAHYLPIGANTKRLSDVFVFADDIKKYSSSLAVVKDRTPLNKNFDHIVKNLYSKYHAPIYASYTDTCGPVSSEIYVDYYNELPKIMKLSKIDLTFLPPSGISANAWNICGCCGFLMCSYSEELLEYFDMGKEIEVFTSEEELLSKTSYYLSNDHVRCKMAKRAYDKICSYHTFYQRVEKLNQLIIAD